MTSTMIMTSNLCTTAMALLLLGSQVSFAQEIATTSREEICSKVDGMTYSRRHRALLLENDRATEFEHAGIPYSLHRQFELDHIIPLCAGGADTPLNRRPQPNEEAKKKDRLEARVCKLICAGYLKPEDAQKLFLNWKKAYAVMRDTTANEKEKE